MTKAASLQAASVSFPSGYDVKDLNLADQGNLRVEWATQDMPVLQGIANVFGKKNPCRASAWQPASMLLLKPRS